MVNIILGVKIGSIDVPSLSSLLHSSFQMDKMCVRALKEITGFHILGVTSGQSPNVGACKCLGDC